MTTREISSTKKKRLEEETERERKRETYVCVDKDIENNYRLVCSRGAQGGVRFWK